jgi:hypothetical protein
MQSNSGAEVKALNMCRFASSRRGVYVAVWRICVKKPGA